MTNLLSIEQWALREKISVRKAYRWAKTGKLPTKPRIVETQGVLPSITKKDLVK